MSGIDDGDAPPPGTQFDLVCVGVIAEDTIAEISRPAGRDDRVLADSIIRAGGGPAATAAVAAARSGLRVAVVGCVGDDPVGHGSIADLEREGVDTAAVQVVPGSDTSQSVIVVDRSSDSRTIYNREGPPIGADLGERAVQRMTGADWVHCDQFGWRAARSVLMGSRRRPRLSVDAGNEIEGLSLDGVSLYAPTEAKLRARYGASGGASLSDLVARAIADGAEIVAATRGSDGAVGMARGGSVVQVAAPGHSPIRSTLGAGDVFHGALLAALRRFGYRDAGAFEHCLAYACLAATRSCRALDGRSAIPTYPELCAELTPARQEGEVTHVRH